MLPVTQGAPEALATLFSKIATVTAGVATVPKNGFNSFHKYRYTTERDLLDALRGLLADQKLAIVPGVAHVEQFEAGDTKGGAVTRVTMTFTLVCGDTGASLTVGFAGDGQDKADKGIYKAYTGALKYFLMKCFLVPTGDDPEQEEAQPQAAPQRQVASPQPAVNPRSDRRAKLIDRVLELAGTKAVLDPGYRVPTRDELGAFNEDGIEQLGHKLKAEIEALQIEGR